MKMEKKKEKKVKKNIEEMRERSAANRIRITT